MSEKTLNIDNFDKEINNTDKLVLIDFYATWCGPCQMLSPIIEEIAEEYADKLEVFKVNVDSNQELAIKYDVLSIPTLMYFKNGKMLNTTVGFIPKTELKNVISELLNRR